MLYPFAATAVAINLFMLALLWTWVGLPAITPVAAVIWCLPLGVPAAWGLGRWARRLMDEADD